MKGSATTRVYTPTGRDNHVKVFGDKCIKHGVRLKITDKGLYCPKCLQDSLKGD